MFSYLFKKLFGSKNQRYLKKCRPAVQRINELEAQMQALEDTELPLRLAEYRRQHEQGRRLDALLPEVFALVRERPAAG